MKKASIVLVALLALLTVVLSGDQASAATYGAEGNHLYWVLDTSSGAPYAVNVQDEARTREYKSGGVMVMDYHWNAIEVVWGRCHYAFPFCFDPPYGPKTKYYHPGNSYNLTDWSYVSCVGPWENLISCWRSYKLLGWATWPVSAKASRKVRIDDYPPYCWLPSCSGYKTSYTPTYQVY